MDELWSQNSAHGWIRYEDSCASRFLTVLVAVVLEGEAQVEFWPSEQSSRLPTSGHEAVGRYGRCFHLLRAYRLVTVRRLLPGEYRMLSCFRDEGNRRSFVADLARMVARTTQHEQRI
jgi:hypothetical protein